jgi:hypothetical protein
VALERINPEQLFKGKKVPREKQPGTMNLFAARAVGAEHRSSEYDVAVRHFDIAGILTIRLPARKDPLSYVRPTLRMADIDAKMRALSAARNRILQLQEQITGKFCKWRPRSKN